MKRILFFFLAFSMVLSSSAQFVKMMNQKANVIAPMRKYANVDLPVVGEKHANGYVSNKSVLTDPQVCVTRYDMQTNLSNQRRIYYYPDGTIGTTTMWSQQNTSWTDRGTGYNYFNGSTWGTLPTARVETIKTGWPEYHPFGPTGELIIAHQTSGPLVMNTRTVKGTGAWIQTLLPTLPSSITGILYPRVVTNGTNHTNIHIIALTLPTADGGQLYNGMDGALLYCNSLDGGTTWSAWQQLPGMTGTDYTNFTADTYSWAESNGNVLAFTVGDSWKDQFLMKSTDNGTTWTKIIIHQSLYDLGGNSSGWFYCPDGTMSVALDEQNMAHVAFGLLSDSGSSTLSFYRPYTQGIVYWNEYMPQLRQDLNPDSLLLSGNIVGWVKDTNVFHPPSGVTLATYFTSLTSNPELMIVGNEIGLAWAGATLLVDPNNFTFRHIFGRGAIIYPPNVVTWCSDTIIEITSDWIQYNFSECMYPCASPNWADCTGWPCDNLLFQADDYAGSYIKSINAGSGYAGQTIPDDNYITVTNWIPCWWEGIAEKHEKPTISVCQNFPNPVNGLTKVRVYLQYGGDLSLTVTNLTGQTIMSMEKTNVLPGVSEFVIDGSQLAPGVYFYTVKEGYQSITKKMIIDN
jgi:hypothetical protein